MTTPLHDRSDRPFVPSRRTLLRAMAALPASALVLGELPVMLGTATAAAPPNGSATRYTIVPFLNSDDGTVNVYQSDDATDCRLVRSSAYTPPTNRIRDASIFQHTDGYYYITYTTHTWQDTSTTIGFARSSHRVDWTFLYDYTVPIANLSRAWAPEWFVDSDGSVNVIVSCSTVAPLRDHSGALRSHAPDAAWPALRADDATFETRPTSCGWKCRTARTSSGRTVRSCPSRPSRRRSRVRHPLTPSTTTTTTTTTKGWPPCRPIVDYPDGRWSRPPRRASSPR